MFKTIRTILSVLLIFTFSFPIQSAQAQTISARWLYQSLPQSTGVVRARIIWSNAYQGKRLEALGVSILEQGDHWALVLATGEQMEALARLRYAIQTADDLGLLLQESAPASPDLAARLAPVARSLASLDMDTLDDPAAQQSLIQSLSAEQAAEISAFSSIDDDGDGLTNSQEGWWCTDPQQPDSDNDGTGDGAEVQALKDWVGNRRAGPPGGTPWSSWPFNATTCPDKDYDSIPNLAERWELGLNMDWESTDHDKFDDGQEVFGVTYCPGGDLSCGYGDLPRSSDSGYVGQTMPAWVKAPGNHPMVTAFPLIDVDIVPSSLRVQVVTTVTTDHVISSGTEKSYSTAKMEGASTSVANTVTWNEWQEVSDGISQRLPADAALNPGVSAKTGESFLKKISRFGMGSTKIIAGTLIAGAGANPATCGGLVVKSALIGGLVVGSSSVGIGAPIGVAVGAGLGLAACGLAIVGGTMLADSGVNDIKRKDQVDAQLQPKKHEGGETQIKSVVDPENAVESVINQCADTDTIVKTGEGTRYTYQPSGQLASNEIYEIKSLLSAPVQTHTETAGKSWGGAQTTTTEKYEEYTVTNGEAFSSEESWGNATAVDSAHAADLRFTYKIRNDGKEYARQICNLAFNVYIGNNPNPATTYFIGPDLGGSGCFANFMPEEEHTYTSHSIALSLDQMKAIDLGGTLRVVLEDYSYGVDELYYLDAANSSVLLAMEDGPDDGDETIDHYIIPTWGSESTLDVLARYFPHTLDENSGLNAIWTPEQRSDTPTWCIEPLRHSISSVTVWCKHALTTSDWWNVYADGMGNGTEGFQDTLAAPGQTALFRFNQDNDLDGYSDRSENRLGTDPSDAFDFPHPELLAGIHSITNGSYVTATLSLLNTGLYDAHGVEAVMVAPDDSITIINNIVGGSGRVRAQKQVVVGSRITLQLPLPGVWSQAGHATPTASGYYTGTTDLNYTFTVSCASPGGCDVGVGTWTINWMDGHGGSGSLNFGADYLSPSQQVVGAYGVKLALLTGKVYSGESFAIAATTPSDTFQYSINRYPHSQPVVIVSYNDPQGNHRFIVPPETMALSLPSVNLAAFSGKMLPDVGVEMVTSAPAVPGSNALDLLINLPISTTMVNSHLFLEFVNITGTVVSESPFTYTLQAGPNVVPLTWNTTDFSPAYNPDEDYIVMAFWTDYEGNILDTAGRPLSSFQDDPRPASAMAAADELWDFGSAQQGTLMQRQFILGSTGYMDLLTYMGNTTGINVQGPSSLPVAPMDTAIYTVTLNTQYLAIGPYSKTISIHTSDPDHPIRVITIQGTVTPITDIPSGEISIRPLDWTVTFSGAHSPGEWLQYSHTILPDPQRLHPVKVFDSSYSTFWGVGKYATDFGPDTASYDMFGDGSDGDLTITSNTTFSPVDASCSGTSGTTLLNATNGAFQAGQKILIHQTKGVNAGVWEINKIASYSAGNITTFTSLENTYTDNGSTSQAQVIVLKQYHNVTVNPGVSWSAKAWDGNVGGILAFLSNGIFLNNGTVSASGKGFMGGITASNEHAMQGNSATGDGDNSTAPNGTGGGGGALGDGAAAGGGGGGGLGTAGTAGGPGSRGAGAGGNTGGSGDLSVMIFGGAGGGGGTRDGTGGTSGPGVSGGASGGIILIGARTMTIGGSSSIVSSGSNGSSPSVASSAGGGGGGAGGSIFLMANQAALGSSRVTAVGGSGGVSDNDSQGGVGGVGQIHIETCEPSTGSTNPSANTKDLTCYTVEQIEDGPFIYVGGSMRIPETIIDTKTYQIQYGRRFNFTGDSTQVNYIRLNRQIFSAGSMDLLVSNTNVSAGNIDLCVDLGNDGVCDYANNSTLSLPISLSTANFVDALNLYLLSRTDIPWGSPVDVPVRVHINRLAQVLLTNLVLTPSSAKTRLLRLPAKTYGDVRLAVRFLQPGVPSGPLAFTVDVGANDSIDCSFAQTVSFPAQLTCNENLSAAVNSYLSGRTGDVSIPIRITPSRFIDTYLDSVRVTLANQPDLTITPSDITFSADTPVESDPVTIQVIIHNPGSEASSPATAAFFASLPDWGDWYLGSRLLPPIPAGGQAELSLDWNTLGFPGITPVKVVVDPYNRLSESSETNNAATSSLTILTRPDLAIIGLNDPPIDWVDTVTATVGLTLTNLGQTDAGLSTVALYDGNPQTGGVLIGEMPFPAQANSQVRLEFPWTPSGVGERRLFAVADHDKIVNEADKSNNLAWVDVVVGLKSPVLMDSGLAGSDPLYDLQKGYGYIDEGQPDALTTCGVTPEPENTLRRDPDGRVRYQFNHLVPSHYYHLDFTLYECDGAGRQESVMVDGYRLAGPIDLGDGKVHHISLLIDPALYIDRELDVAIEAAGINGAVVSEVNLYDMDYRYADAGNMSDLVYSVQRGFGWLDPSSIASVNWGKLPYQSVRVDQSDDNLSYRFDRLRADRKYKVHLTFWQKEGTPNLQKVYIDSQYCPFARATRND